ncbi:terminase [Micrococcus terreus]|uniref:terminase n=1 Tax=Micrococcus terreus TaxID=574650 RepID=UPI0021A26E95|nr:terminase [Micrococcus terreus]MCT2088345.1 terminase [Micrococcus terreus]
MTTEPTPIHQAPRGLRAGGKRLWTAVTDEFELAEHELSVLVEACRTVDALAELEKIIRAEGVTNVSPQGVRAHPALVEARQQRVTLAKLVASLRIPMDDAQSVGRLPQQRVGIRAVK